MAEYPNCSSLGNRSFHPWWPEGELSPCVICVGVRSKPAVLQTCSTNALPVLLPTSQLAAARQVKISLFSHCVLCSLPLCSLDPCWSWWGPGVLICHRQRQRLLVLQTLWCQCVHSTIGAGLKLQKSREEKVQACHKETYVGGCRVPASGVLFCIRFAADTNHANLEWLTRDLSSSMSLPSVLKN